MIPIPWDWAWLLRKIFMAISPAIWMVLCLLAPEETLPAAALSSNSYDAKQVSNIFPRTPA